MILSHVLVLSTVLLMSQQPQNSLFVESWKKGKQQIQEQSLTVELKVDAPRFEAKIRDLTGKERYKLSLQLRVDQGYPPTGYVELVEKALIGFKGTNLLQPSNDPYQDYFTGEDYVSVLDPAMQNGRCQLAAKCASLYTKRIIKVKGFYCILQVTKYNESPASISVQVEFTNKSRG
jgi:hypothetical protein